MKKRIALLLLTSLAGMTQAQGYYQGGGNPTAPQSNGQTQGQPVYNSQPNFGNGNYSNNNYSNYSQQYNGNGQVAPPSDGSIQTQIQNQLKSYQSQGKYNDVTFTVNSGNVVLNGTVDNQDDKDALGRIFGSINGVRSVTNQVIVQNGGQNGSYSYNQSRTNNSGYQGYSNNNINPGYNSNNSNYYNSNGTSNSGNGQSSSQGYSNYSNQNYSNSNSYKSQGFNSNSNY